MLPAFWFTVPEGFYALVTRFGKEEMYPGSGPPSPCWPSGIHFGPPWLKVSHLVTKQSMVFNRPVRGCKTSDNVTVEIDMNIVLRVMGDEKGSSVDRPNDDPENVRKFVHNLTAEGLAQQLEDAQAEAIRTMARSVTHTEVFGLRTISAVELEENMARIKAASSFSEDEDESDYEDGQEKKDLEGDHDVIDKEEAVYATEYGASVVTKTLKHRLNKQFRPQGIEILEVIIEHISLPNSIQDQMSQKTMVVSANAEQRMQHKHDLQVLEQTEAIKMIKQRHREEVRELKQDGQAQEIEERLKLDLMKEEAEKEISKIAVQNSRDVQVIKYESSFKVKKVNELCEKEVSRVQLTAALEAAKTHADADFFCMDVSAKAKLECAQLSAKADDIVFKAEGVSAPKNRTLNNYLTEMRKLEVQNSLAENDQVIITGTSGGNAANKLLQVDACLSDAKVSRTSSDGIAELAIASGKADIRLYTNGNPQPVKNHRISRT